MPSMFAKVGLGGVGCCCPFLGSNDVLKFLRVWVFKVGVIFLRYSCFQYLPVFLNEECGGSIVWLEIFKSAHVYWLGRIAAMSRAVHRFTNTYR